MLRIHRTKLSQNKLSWMSWLGLAGTVSCCALILVFGFMLFPSLPQVVDAADWYPERPASDASVSINLPASIDFDSVTPTPDGATTTATADLTVTTTNSASYSLYLYSSDGDNSLRPKISANTSSIIATAGDVGLTLSSLKPNTWGYNLGTEAPTDSTTYSAVPTDNSTPIQTKDTSATNSANDTYTLSFGAKVDMAAASGTYSNTLTIAVVAEPKKITLSQITNMQEMTSEICSNSTENETKRLTDTRDGKQYWVAKLKDDNCWMTQNLALDLSTSTPLTSADSDVTSSWTPGYNTQSSPTVGSTDRTATYSWNFGNYVLTNPTSDSSCGGRGVTSLSQCAAVGFQNVSGMTAMSTARTDGIVIDGNTYDAHYLTGNYYQWNAATAGSGGTIIGQKATDSICPKGWHLPTTLRDTDSFSGSGYYLLSRYGINSDLSDTSAVALAPLYFVFSGSIYLGGNTISHAGSDGSYWSSYANDNFGARMLNLSSTGIHNGVVGLAYDSGASVRCLAD